MTTLGILNEASSCNFGAGAHSASARPTPIHRRLYDGFRAAILDGRMRPFKWYPTGKYFGYRQDPRTEAC
jgi:hypothetical protein